MKNKTDLAVLSDEQLVHRALDLERTLAGNHLRHRLNKLENNSLLGATRRDIARAKTELRQRELSNGLVNGALHDQFRGSWAPSAAPATTEAGGGFLKSVLDGTEAPG